MADKQLDEKQLQALLRLKRYEEPPPAYFDSLLVSIQLRQREEILQPRGWRRAGWDRLKTYLSLWKVDWAYAGSMAAILVIGIGVIQIVLPYKSIPSIQTASTQPPTTTVVSRESLQPANSPMLTLQPSRSPMLQNNFELAPLETTRGSHLGPARYVIDAQPVSYESTQIRF